MNLAEDINAAIDLVEKIEQTQEITWRGNEGRTRDPHGTNPTAVKVDRAKNRFYNFKSGKYGGPIDWVMDRDGLPFTEARDLLAKQCGLNDSPTFEERRASLKLAQSEMRAFSAFLSVKRQAVHAEIRRVRQLRDGALCFIELLGEIDYEETEERRAIAAEGCADGESAEVAGVSVLASDIRNQLANLHATVTAATQRIDALESALDQTHFKPETEVEGFLRTYYATTELREALA